MMGTEYFARCFDCLETVFFPNNNENHMCPNGCPVVFRPEHIVMREVS